MHNGEIMHTYTPIISAANESCSTQDGIVHDSSTLARCPLALGAGLSRFRPPQTTDTEEKEAFTVLGPTDWSLLFYVLLFQQSAIVEPEE